MTTAPSTVASAAVEGRRPSTFEPTEILTITSEDLRFMSAEQLCKFADEQLGIPISPTEPIGKILTRIENAAMGARDGL